MHIILVSNRLATARTFVITPRFVWRRRGRLHSGFFTFRAVLVAVGAVPPAFPRGTWSFRYLSPKPPAATPTCATTSTPWRPSWVKCRPVAAPGLAERTRFQPCRHQAERTAASLRGAQGSPLLLAQPRTADELDNAVADRPASRCAGGIR